MTNLSLTLSQYSAMVVLLDLVKYIVYINVINIAVHTKDCWR